MEGLILVLFLGLLGLGSYLFLLQKRIQNLSRQLEAFLDGADPLPISLKDAPLDALQNGISRLQNRLRLSGEQTKQEAARSTRLLTDISHQLKTPLSSLRLFIELDGGSHLEEELRLLDRMQALISSLLRLERLCADGYPFSFSSQSLAGIVENCWASLEPLYPEKAFTLEGAASLYCDKTWMTEAVTNLLKNACEHTPAQGNITVRISETAQEVKCTVSDNGGGVEPQELPRLFDRFYQAKGRKSTGAGIGLSIVKEIVWRHHGQISAANIPGGLEFTMYFPKLDVCLAKS